MYSETVDPVIRANDNELFLLRLEVAPLPDNPQNKAFGGAYANALVDAATLREAEEQMLANLQSEGWKPVCFDHWEMVCRDCYRLSENPTTDEVREAGDSIDMAFKHGIDLTFYTWPVNEDDESENGEQPT